MVILQEIELGPNSFQNRENIFFALYSLLLDSRCSWYSELYFSNDDASLGHKVSKQYEWYQDPYDDNFLYEFSISHQVLVWFQPGILGIFWQIIEMNLNLSFGLASRKQNYAEQVMLSFENLVERNPKENYINSLL